jgi:hypothetical protein
MFPHSPSSIALARLRFWKSEKFEDMLQDQSISTFDSCPFPIWTVCSSGDTVLYAGGGGQAKTGIPNAAVRVTQRASAQRKCQAFTHTVFVLFVK